MSSYRRYNYRAYPTKGQRAALACLYGACRYAALNILDAAGLAESLNARRGDVRRRLACASRNADANDAGTHRTASLH